MPKTKSPKTKVPKTKPLGRALELLAEGRWQPAHEIVQKEESALGAWLHGIVHTLEGDLDNARYWYKRAKREFPGGDAVKREIAAAWRHMGGPEMAPHTPQRSAAPRRSRGAPRQPPRKS